MINQFFGGRGGNADTPVSHDFVELFNSDAIDIDMSGWTLHVSSSRVGALSRTTTFPYGTIIPARHSFLIRGVAMTSSTELRANDPVPLALNISAFDLAWNIMFIDNGNYVHIVLRNVDGDVIDAFSNRIGAPLMGEIAINMTSRQRSARRINFQSTNNNARDFQGIAWGCVNQPGTKWSARRF